MTDALLQAYGQLRKAAEDCLFREDIADDPLGNALAEALASVEQAEQAQQWNGVETAS